MTTEFLRTSATVAASAVVLAFAGVLTAEPRVAGPSEHVYRVAGSRQLRLFLFSPAEAPAPGSRRAAILLFHGGGWHVGEPSWMFASAQRYAAGGMVAAAVEYRLSDQKTVTPIEAMDDARWAVRWIREHANELHLDPARVAASGVSAGAHLAAATAVIPGPEVGDAAVPNALVLTSPAVSLANDGWFRRLLLGRVDPVVLSPDQQVRTAPPPAILFVGAEDTVTPAPGAERFCEAARGAGGRCDVHVYPGVGHLFTRNLDPRAQEAGPFDPAPDVQADVRARTETFLMSLGYFARR